MANTQIDRASADAISLEVFPGGSEVWDQMDRKTPGLDLVERTNKIPFAGKVSSDGKYIVLPVCTDDTANPAIPYPETGGLATPGRAETDQLQFNVVSLNQAIELTGLVMDTLDGSPSSVQDVMTFQMRKQMPAARKEMNWHLHRDASGQLGQLSSTDGSGVVTLNTGSTTGRLKVGSDVDIRVAATAGGGAQLSATVSGTQIADAMRVSAVGSSTAFTVTDVNGNALTTATGDTTYGVYRYGAQGNGMWGFGNWVSYQNPQNMGGSSAVYLGNVDRDTYEWWQGLSNSSDYSFCNAGGTPSIRGHIQPMIDALRERGGDFIEKDKDGNIWTVFCGRQNFRALGNAMQADQRTAGKPMKLRGGYDAVEFDGAAFVVDDDADPARLRFIHTPSLRRFVNKPWFWNDKDGFIWSRRTTSNGRDADIYRAYMITRQQMLGVRCLLHGEIFGTGATLLKGS